MGFLLRVKRTTASRERWLFKVLGALWDKCRRQNVPAFRKIFYHEDLPNAFTTARTKPLWSWSTDQLNGDDIEKHLMKPQKNYVQGVNLK
jgi:hypothetical protein